MVVGKGRAKRNEFRTDRNRNVGIRFRVPLPRFQETAENRGRQEERKRRVEEDEIPLGDSIGRLDLVRMDDRVGDEDRNYGFRLGAVGRRSVGFGDYGGDEFVPERNLDDAPPTDKSAEVFGHEIREPFGIEGVVGDDGFEEHTPILPREAEWARGKFNTGRGNSIGLFQVNAFFLRRFLNPSLQTFAKTSAYERYFS